MAGALIRLSAPALADESFLVEHTNHRFALGLVCLDQVAVDACAICAADRKLGGKLLLCCRHNVGDPGTIHLSGKIQVSPNTAKTTSKS